MMEYELFACINENCSQHHQPVTVAWSRSDPMTHELATYGSRYCRECRDRMTEAELIPEVLKVLLEADAAMLAARSAQ